MAIRIPNGILIKKFDILMYILAGFSYKVNLFFYRDHKVFSQKTKWSTQRGRVREKILDYA